MTLYELINNNQNNNNNLKQSKMIVKNGHWNENMTQPMHEEAATIGQPLLVSCIYKSADITPNLTLTWNSRPWDSISASSRQGDLTTGGVSIGFVLILWLPYDYFYGAYKSKLIRFHIKF